MSDRMKVVFKKVALVIVIFAFGAFAGIISYKFYSQQIAPAKQVRTLAIIQTWQRALFEVYEDTGKYPSTLHEAAEHFAKLRPSGTDMTKLLKDNWGASLHYFSNGDSYILGSFGRDQSCDLINLRAYIEHSIVDRSPCYDPDRDTIANDQGIIKCCGK